MEDKKINKSQEKIINSLLTLMAQKSLNSITVKEITENSNLSRKTFYRNFSKKEDVLFKYMTSIHLSYLGKLTLDDDSDIMSMIMFYFNFWYERKDLLLILHDQNLFHILNHSLEELVCIASPLIKSDDIELYKPLFLDYYNVYLAGSVTSILKYWTVRNFKETPTEISKITLDLARNNIHS